MGLRKVYKLKHRRKYDTDKYMRDYWPTIFNGEESVGYDRKMWEARVYVGPGTYNKGHVDNVMYNDANSLRTIMEPKNPYYYKKSYVEGEKFKI